MSINIALTVLELTARARTHTHTHTHIHTHARARTTQHTDVLPHVKDNHTYDMNTKENIDNALTVLEVTAHTHTHTHTHTRTHAHTHTHIHIDQCYHTYNTITLMI
jgi:hypothetical protein